MLVTPHFVGTTCESSDIMSVMRCFITELQFKNYGNGVKLLTSGSFCWRADILSTARVAVLLLF